MTTLEFARKYIRFEKSGTPITGPFREEFYPFILGPFEAADDIRCKRLVIYKAASCMGTVVGQIINAKRIVCDVGDQKMVCQTDDDAEIWSKTRGKEWLRSIDDAMRLVSRDKYAITNTLWMFRHKFLEISGPGISSAQSVQVRYLQTDEAHLQTYERGRLAEFEKRMGGRWNRQSTHITTAPNEGREVDVFYTAGDQSEWHWRCPNCEYLVWPLWGERAKKFYDQPVFERNGAQVMFRCPFCGNPKGDTARERYELNRNGDYLAQNPGADVGTRSFRWSVFAAHWIPWSDIATEHDSTIAAARNGDLKPLEDFEKKRLCFQWRPYLPDWGDGKGASDYNLGDAWECGEYVRILAADVQAGKADEGAHLWALVTQWDRMGNSRRLAYRRVETFGQLESLREEFKVESKNVHVDSGHENRMVFRECGRRKWYATRGSDAAEILHTIERDGKLLSFPMPYSQTEPQSGVVGEKQPDRLKRVRKGNLPHGWAYCIVMANPTLYGYLSALIGGASGRYFGIAKDFPAEYTSLMPAFIPHVVKDKQQREKIVWKQVRAAHPWDCEVQSLVGAMRAGYFPVGKTTEQTT